MVDGVLVVGAGPVGLTMALELARYRVPVRIVDSITERASTSRAIVLWPRTLELLDRTGGSDDFVSAGLKVSHASVHAEARALARMSFSDIDSLYQFALMLPQSETEAFLQRRLEALGVTCELGVALTEIAQDDEGVAVSLRHADGRVEAARFGWVVGCDGAHSTVRHGLGLSFEGDTIETDWGLGDFHLSGFPLGLDELATYWHRDGPIVYLPLAPGRYRIIASLGPSKGARPVPPSVAAFQSLVDTRGPAGVRLGDPVWLSAFRINERQVPTYRSGRVFLAGDAAHVHSPAGGQGMNTGMQDAFNLAWKLSLVVRGLAAGPLLLDSYSAERHAVGAEVIAQAGRLTKIALVANPVLQELRNHVLGLVLGLSPVRDAMTAQIAEVSIGYGRSGLNGPGERGGRPGQRVRPLAGEVPYGAGDRPLFVVRASGPLPFAHPLVHTAVRPKTDGAGIDLVRPDGYLAMSAREGDWEAVTAYLDRLT